MIRTGFFHRTASYPVSAEVIDQFIPFGCIGQVPSFRTNLFRLVKVIQPAVYSSIGFIVVVCPASGRIKIQVLGHPGLRSDLNGFIDLTIALIDEMPRIGAAVLDTTNG